jgi:hypothetical protein
MNDESLLLHRLTLLGKAMRPVWQKLVADLDISAGSSAPVLNMAATVLHELLLTLKMTAAPGEIKPGLGLR